MEINEFIENQKSQKNDILVTIEELENDDKNVKITPWIEGSNCQCGYSLVLEKNKIENVEPIDQTKQCCNKKLTVVKIFFKKEASLTYSELFVSLIENIQRKQIHQDSISTHAKFSNSPLDYHEDGYEIENSSRCPRGYHLKKCSALGPAICVKNGSFCCGGMVCPPGTRCVANGSGFYCERR